MAYSKNDIVQVTIEDIGVTGEGIGKIDGYTLFVKDTVIGDVVEVKIMKAKKNYGYARLMNIITPSKDRVTPECNIARQCGGCQLQAMSYAAQLKYKQKLVSDNLQRIGGLTEGVDYEMCDILGMDTPFRYRNKAQYPVGEDKDGNIIMGFYAGHTHSIIPCDDCLLGDENNSVILTAVKQWMKDYRVRAYNENIHKGTLRHILIRTGFHTDEIMVCLVTKKMLKKEAADGLVRVIERLNSGSSVSDNTSSGSDNNTSNNSGRKLNIASLVVNINKEDTNVILGRECVTLYGRPYIEDYIGDIKFQISPLSFFQVNPKQTEVLYKKALEFANLTGNEAVWDLYCGIGTISLFLAKNAGMVYGVEIVPQAIEDAKNNAGLNGIDNAEFFVGKAEEVVTAFYESRKADDGHNIEELERMLNISKQLEGPVLIHVLTKKGKGYKIAEENPDKFHATGPFEIETGKPKKEKSKDYSKVFGDKLVELAKKNDKIVAITASMKDGTGLTKFAKEFPDRFFDIGIAEQHALGLAAGMAKEGVITVVPIYSSFYQRAYDQVIHDIAIQNLPVIMCVDRAGVVGADRRNTSRSSRYGVF